MIIKSVNCDNLYIDESFKSIDDLKAKIYEKYGIPTETQHIMFNGKFYVLGLFEDLSEEQPKSDDSNPFSELGCPESLYASLVGRGMDMNAAKNYLFPHKEDADEKASEVDIAETVSISKIAKEIAESEYGDVQKVSESLTDQQKSLILKNSESYVDLILRDLAYSK